MSDEKSTSDRQQPNGSSADWSYIDAGAKLSSIEAKVREKTLQSEPDNLACRLELLGFYGKRPSGQDKYFEHMLWMIDNRSGDYVVYHMGHDYNSRALVWNKSREREASIRWSRQVKQHFESAIVLCNAASFFSSCDPPTSDRLYKRAKKLNRKLALPARQLAYEYRYRATKATPKDRAALIRLALNEAEDALQRQDGRGERIGVLTEFTPTAIKFGHLKLARKFATRLQYYGRGFYLYNQYAYLNLAWLAFKENRTRALNARLKRLQELFEQNPTHVASCNAALTFVNDVLNSGQKDLAERLLNILIIGENDPAERREFENWLVAVKKGRKPKLKLLKKRMDSLF